ncbi:MAG: DUF3035 domain-containing protein [Rhodobacteraceae bacterium]|nr:DUF3035 domain-containing protein [Paracoccaceae bacterium]MCY4196413.1 DUF3035 domain-containing protein [Paracoccaceae bacterium]
MFHRFSRHHQSRLMRLAIVLTGAIALAGCNLVGGDDNDEPPKLLQFKNDGRPDALATVPTRPLVYPDRTMELKPPDLLRGNRADRRPDKEVIVSLGGEARQTAGQYDRHLVSHATRHGYDPLIRRRLETEDIEFRRRNDGRLLERVFRVNLYFDAYRPMSIDPYVELQRLRAAGIRTPTAPPPN